MAKRGFRPADVDDRAFAVRYDLVDDVMQIGSARLGIVHLPGQSREQVLETVAGLAGRMVSDWAKQQRT